MDINEVHGKIKLMKHFIIMINQLQKSISRSNLTCIVPSTKYNQQILHILQTNGFINGFKILDNSKQIIVYFKFVQNANVIKRIFRFKRFDRSVNLYKKKNWYHSVGFTYFTILSGRNGLSTSKECLLRKDFDSIPVLGIL